MNGKVGDLQQRSLHMYEQRLRFQGVVGTQYDPSRDGEGSVEPCRHDGSAIDLGVEFDDTPLAEHLRIGFDAEGG